MKLLQFCNECLICKPVAVLCLQSTNRCWCNTECTPEYHIWSFAQTKCFHDSQMMNILTKEPSAAKSNFFPQPLFSDVYPLTWNYTQENIRGPSNLLCIIIIDIIQTGNMWCVSHSYTKVTFTIRMTACLLNFKLTVQLLISLVHFYCSNFIPRHNFNSFIHHTFHRLPCIQCQTYTDSENTSAQIHVPHLHRLFLQFVLNHLAY